MMMLLMQVMRHTLMHLKARMCTLRPLRIRGGIDAGGDGSTTTASMASINGKGAIWMYAAGLVATGGIAAAYVVTKKVRL